MPTTTSQVKSELFEFDTVRDNTLIEAGTHFYCQTCLCARLIEEQSEDPRYCQSCCEFLLQEAEHCHSRAPWVPKVSKRRIAAKPADEKAQDAHSIKQAPSVEGDIIPDYISTPSSVSPIIMSTLETSTPAKEKTQRGPKQKPLPIETIKLWADEGGLGSKAIAARLNSRGIKISYKTIQRILNGKRPLEL